jgi:hypothetical protein
VQVTKAHREKFGALWPITLKVVKNMLYRRKIDMKKGQKILAHLDEIPDPLLSARQFIVRNFDTLQQSGKALRALHTFFQSNGLNAGTFEYFQSVYNSVKRARKTQAKVQAAIPASEKTVLADAVSGSSLSRFE